MLNIEDLYRLNFDERRFRMDEEKWKRERQKENGIQRAMEKV